MIILSWSRGFVFGEERYSGYLGPRPKAIFESKKKFVLFNFEVDKMVVKLKTLFHDFSEKEIQSTTIF